MGARIIQLIFSFSGLSIAIGCLGSIAAIVTLFVDTEALVSVKWLLFMGLISLWLIVVLAKIIHDRSTQEEPQSLAESPIKYVDTENVFVIRRNANFLNSIVVACYLHEDEIDRLAYIGTVHIVQDNVIQIRVKKDFGIVLGNPSDSDNLRRIVIRPVLPVSALREIDWTEANNVE